MCRSSLFPIHLMSTDGTPGAGIMEADDLQVTNFHRPTIGTRQTEYQEALPSSANVQSTSPRRSKEKTVNASVPASKEYRMLRRIKWGALEALDALGALMIHSRPQRSSGTPTRPRITGHDYKNALTLSCRSSKE